MYFRPSCILDPYVDFRTFLYRSIFEFLYGFLEPGYELPPQKTQPMHEVMTDILKKIRYPGTVSKSHFQTLGGPSWGSICGVLDFFLQLAKLFVTVSSEKNFRLMNFPHEDADGFVIDDSGTRKTPGEIEYNFFMDTYAAYQKGQDEFPDHENRLYWDLMDSKGVNEEDLAQLEKEFKTLKQENAELKEDMGQVDHLTEESSKVLSDIKGLQDYLEKQQKYFSLKQSNLKATKENVQLFINKIDELKESISMLETECRSKGIDPKNSSSHVEECVMSLQSRVEAKREDIAETDKLIWKQEQKIGKRMAVLDQLKRDYNRIIISLDIDEAESKALKGAELPEVQNLIVTLNLSLKEALKRTKKNVEDLRQNLNLCRAEIEKKSSECSGAKAEENELNVTKLKKTEEIKSQEAELNAKLKVAKEKLSKHFTRKNQVGQDLKEKEDQLEIAKRENRDQKQIYDKVKKEGEQVIGNIMEQMKKVKAEQLQGRDEAFNRFKEHSEKLSAALGQETEKIKRKTADLKSITLKK